MSDAEITEKKFFKFEPKSGHEIPDNVFKFTLKIVDFQMAPVSHFNKDVVENSVQAVPVLQLCEMGPSQ